MKTLFDLSWSPKNPLNLTFHIMRVMKTSLGRMWVLYRQHRLCIRLTKKAYKLPFNLLSLMSFFADKFEGRTSPEWWWIKTLKYNICADWAMNPCGYQFSSPDPHSPNPSASHPSPYIPWLFVHPKSKVCWLEHP